MSVKRSLTICRILVAVLIFNMAMPMAVAGISDDRTVLICTAAGFVNVNIDDFYGVQSTDEQNKKSSELGQAGQHCPFCNLSDTDDNKLNADHLAYPKPDSELVLHYQSVPPLIPSKTFFKHALLRAPPITL